MVHLHSITFQALNLILHLHILSIHYPNNFLHNIHLIYHLIHHLQAQLNFLQGVSMATKSAHSHSTSNLKNFSIIQTPITPLQTLTKQQSKTQTYLWMRLLKSSPKLGLLAANLLPKWCRLTLMKEGRRKEA